MILRPIIYSKKWCLHLLMFKISMMQHFAGNGYTMYLTWLWIISTLTYFPVPWPALGDISWIYIATISSVTNCNAGDGVTNVTREFVTQTRRLRCGTRSPPGAKRNKKSPPTSHLPPWPLTLASLCLTTLFFTHRLTGDRRQLVMREVSYSFLRETLDPGEWNRDNNARGETTDELT
mgnify:CR=1 FL=1